MTKKYNIGYRNIIAASSGKINFVDNKTITVNDDATKEDIIEAFTDVGGNPSEIVSIERVDIATIALPEERILGKMER